MESTQDEMSTWGRHTGTSVARAENLRVLAVAAAALSAWARLVARVARSAHVSSWTAPPQPSQVREVAAELPCFFGEPYGLTPKPMDKNDQEDSAAVRLPRGLYGSPRSISRIEFTV
ncbi:MAG: hypothetical protein JWP97_6512 [Labilithrix sp.]|nr:hypothetical protein [Labilithrix sp.]